MKIYEARRNMKKLPNQSKSCQIHPNYIKLWHKKILWNKNRGPLGLIWPRLSSVVSKAIHGLHGSVIPPQNVIQHPAWQRSPPILDYLQHIIVQQQDWEANTDVFRCIKDHQRHLPAIFNKVNHASRQSSCLKTMTRFVQIQLMRRSDTTKSTKSTGKWCILWLLCWCTTSPSQSSGFSPLRKLYKTCSRTKWKHGQSCAITLALCRCARPVRKACCFHCWEYVPNCFNIVHNLFPPPFTLYISLHLFTMFCCLRIGPNLGPSKKTAKEAFLQTHLLLLSPAGSPWIYSDSCPLSIEQME